MNSARYVSPVCTTYQTVAASIRLSFAPSVSAQMPKIMFIQVVESGFPLVTPGDVVELAEDMEDLFIMGTVDGFQKVTKIDGLQDMARLTVSAIVVVQQAA